MVCTLKSYEPILEIFPTPILYDQPGIVEVEDAKKRLAGLKSNWADDRLNMGKIQCFLK